MFFISKNVADGIRALREREHVTRDLEAIKAMPGFEVYVNAIAEGVDDPKCRDDEPPQPEDQEKAP